MTKSEYHGILTEIDWLESEIERMQSNLDALRQQKSEFEMNNPEEDWA